MSRENTPWVLIRIALAFSFLYAGIMIHVNPLNWIGYFPPFINNLSIPGSFLLIGFSVVHIGIALWILSGKRIFIPSLLAALFLAGVVLTNFAQMDILFRDISLMLVAFALAFKNKTAREVLEN